MDQKIENFSRNAFDLFFLQEPLSKVAGKYQIHTIKFFLKKDLKVLYRS